MKIIATFGPQQAGKSEAAKAIATLPRWTRLSFAEPLYAMLSALLGEDARKLDKSASHPFLCGKTLRQALQSLGTEWGRGQIGKTIWLDVMDGVLRYHHAAGSAGVVIDDLRFLNEYQFLRSRGAALIRIEREGCLIPTLNQGHASEMDWCGFAPDKVLRNNGGIEDFHNFARNIAEVAPHAERPTTNA